MGVKMSRRTKSTISNDQLEIFKLKMDHFEEIFDWLSLKDLLELSQTCNRMKRIVGYYIMTKYVKTKLVFSLFNNTRHPSIRLPGKWHTEKGPYYLGLSSFLTKVKLHNLEFIRYVLHMENQRKPFPIWKQIGSNR